MGDRSPYQVLGVSEGASFEEIQNARDRLLDRVEQQGEQTQVEQAYDAILMQRLRLRQEGKIAVPDGIRFHYCSMLCWWCYRCLTVAIAHQHCY